MSLTRREMVAFGLLGGGALLLPLERSVLAAGQNRMAESALPAPFTVPFTPPPVASKVRSEGITDYYSLTMREQATQILPGYQTRIWGYNGSFPGPTLDVQQGREVVVRQINSLPSTHPILGYTPTTSTHLHGSASLPQFDGYASDVTYPGSWKDYRYPNSQGSRTLWYHDHGVHHTASNVYMGLAGMYRMHDPLEQSLPIPQGYYDVPLIVTDAMFDATGQLLYDDNDQSGVFGDVILVNGRPWPVMKVERRKYRFRILNASVARSYRWQLDSGEPLVVIATDAGLMTAPQSVKSLLHGNAERYEVIIDFAKYAIGRRVTLRNLSPKNNVDYTNTNKVMAFDVVAKASSISHNSIPSVLNPYNHIMALTPTDTTPTRTMALVRQSGEWTINGQTWADVVASGYTRALANPALNAVEVWEIHNDSGGWHHPMHIHLVDFKVLDREFDRNGVRVPPRPPERGAKDVVYVGENERVRLITQFGPHRGRYMIHCHNLVHEDHDMMGQFTVGEGGYDPITTAPARPLPAPEL
ncbi:MULTISPECIES: multicopper oxidase family protein [unclassified Knoellia]|uniref:multicopper oxidase family protein n=1 Tax=Knoellia altitudinis TaxID=3404795 RepID=UPI00360C35C7